MLSSFSRNLIALSAALAGGSLLILAGCGSTSGSGGGGSSAAPLVKGSFTSCGGDSVRLFEFAGGSMKKMGAWKADNANGALNFSFNATIPSPGFYYVGTDQNALAMVLLGADAEVEVKGTCPNLNSSAVTSASNTAYTKFMQRSQQYQQQMQAFNQQYQMAMMSDPLQASSIQQQQNTLTSGFQSYLDSVSKSGGVLGQLAGIFSYPNFSPGGKYPTEADHFMGEFFSGTNLAASELDHIPHLHDKAQVYASSLAQRRVADELLLKALNDIAGKTREGSISRRLILLGFINGLDQAKSDLFIDMANAYIAQFPQDADVNTRLAQGVQAKSFLAKGSVAPTFSLPDQNGSKNLGPENFKGKVLLLDFWASWCKPCRMENPNVVAAYQKYKSKGFEILSVSLDQDKAKWLQAMQADGMNWYHCSDLKGWQSSAAGLYGVSSIPSTFLLDKEGKIIAKNLRGAALEQKLEEVLAN